MEDDEPLYDVPDTPPVPKKTMDLPGFDLDTYRDAVLDDIGPLIPEITVASFLKNRLPAMDPAINFDDVVNKLQQGSAPALKLGRGWTAFLTTPGDIQKKEQTSHEDLVYGPFEKIVNAILNTNASKRKRRIGFVQRPTLTLDARFLYYTAKPDGYAYLLPDDGVDLPEAHLWERVVVSAEYKKTGDREKRNENVKKVCSNMSQVMRDDPARRFTYGITIESYNMRFWYCDRSEILVSEQFDLMQDYKFLIEFFLKIAYPPSLWEIGIDTTITLTVVDGRPQYNILVPSTDGTTRVFQTIDQLSMRGSESLRGRGTRVWRVVELLNGQSLRDQFILKDTWIDSDRAQEGCIREAILNDSRGQSKDLLERVLPPVSCHGDVYKISDGIASPQEKDCTRGTLRAMRGFLIRLGPQRLANHAKEASSHSKSSGPINPLKMAYSGSGSRISGTYPKYSWNPDAVSSQPKLLYHPKTHYRVVFREEVGLPLIDVRDLKTVFKVLRATVSALHALHQAGWVHRDISPYNIIYTPDSQDLIRLIDIEYAKKETDPNKHDARTATKCFVAVEAARGRYMVGRPTTESEILTQEGVDLYNPPLSPANKRSRNSNQVEEHTTQNHIAAVSCDPVTSSRLRFRHNRIHDLESLWWIAVYFIFHRVLVSSDGQEVQHNQDTINRQLELAAWMFHSEVVRVHIMTSIQFTQLLDFLPSTTRGLGKKLALLRVSLVKAYSKIELMLRDPTFDNTIHNKFFTTFDQMKNKSGGLLVDGHDDLCLPQGSYSDLFKLTEDHEVKRPRADDDSNTSENKTKRKRSNY